jgi:acyl-CoA dehydrogenase
MMVNLETFRTETRAWLAENYPASLNGAMDIEDDSIWGGRKAVYKNPDAKLWLERMASRGFTAPTWPKEYGLRRKRPGCSARSSRASRRGRR